MLMILGYGKEFLAGHNTANQKQRGAYDEKKLLRVAGSQ